MIKLATANIDFYQSVESHLIRLETTFLHDLEEIIGFVKQLLFDATFEQSVKSYLVWFDDTQLGA